MSRCFPFPPPGYERKHRTEDLDLLKEVKCKEKKQKKDKKDKERKKDKEKEKDGNDEKLRDKKDRKGKRKNKKEKHKEKKKDKEDRGKDKEKSSISEESTVAGKLEEKSGGKLHPKGHSKDRSSFLDEGKGSALLHGQNGGKPSQSCLPFQGNEESKFVQELDRRIRDDEKSRGSQLPGRVAIPDKRDQRISARAAVRNPSGVLAEDNKNRRVDRKVDPQGLRNEFTGNKIVQNLTPMAKSKVEGIPGPVDENGSKLEDKQKYKETDDAKRGNKQKDRDKESHGKEKDKEKEKKKDGKAKVKTENKKSEQDKLKDDRRNDLGGFTVNKNSDLLKDVNSNAVNEVNLRKRRDMDANGFLHECEIRPNKMQRPAPHQLTENGRKFEPFQTATKPSNDNHAAVPDSVLADNKDWLMNGIIEAPKPSPSKPNPSAVADQIAEASKTPHRDSNHLNKALKMPKMEDPIAEASRRPPHPDSKYLAEILTVPKLADWSEYDDQEWLFSKKDPSTKMESVGGKEDLCVWSEAVHIESADIRALPYVIPY